MPTELEILDKRQGLQTYWREAHSRWDTLLNVYHGNYQQLWPTEFRRGEMPKVANWVKLGWDRYAKMVGKIPTNHVPPSTMKRITQTRADKVEKVLVQYDNQSGMSSLMKWYAWYLVGLGASSVGVLPDPVLQGPRMFIKDPRSVLIEPGAGSIPISSTTFGFMSEPTMHAMSINAAIINETMTGSAVLDMYGEAARRQVDDSSVNTPNSVVTYIDKGLWTVLVNDKKILEAENPLDVVPIRFTSMYVPEQLGGQSQFEQNIGLVLAYMRILNQKLTYNANVVWPWLVVKGLSDIDQQSRTITILDREGGAEFLAPPGEIQAERDLEVLDKLIRVMNHDTESMQGEAPGSIVTGRAVDALNQDVKTVVMDYWDIMKPDLEFVKACALAIDEKMYPSVVKEVTGKSKGETFQETYTPGKDIRGYRNVVVDFGIGVGGLEGFTELMQLAAQGFIDEATVMETVPWIQSVSETRRKVLMDRMEKIIFEMVVNSAPAELINHMSAWRVAVEKNQEPYKWIAENPFPQPTPPEMLGAPGEGVPGQPPAPPGAQPGVPGQGAAPQPPGVPNIPSPAQIMALTQGRG